MVGGVLRVVWMKESKENGREGGGGGICDTTEALTATETNYDSKRKANPCGRFPLKKPGPFIAQILPSTTTLPAYPSEEVDGAMLQVEHVRVVLLERSQAKTLQEGSKRKQKRRHEGHSLHTLLKKSTADSSKSSMSE